MRPYCTLLLTVLRHWSANSITITTPKHLSPHPQIQSRDGEPPLPNRKPFGFGSLATGGGEANKANNTFVVDDMMSLCSVLKMDDTPRTVYVRGEIRGNQINETFSGNCQYYIDSSNVSGFNFTLYIMAMNATYTDAVKAAAAKDELFEGRNATEYLALLNHQNVSAFFVCVYMCAGGCFRERWMSWVWQLRTVLV